MKPILFMGQRSGSSAVVPLGPDEKPTGLKFPCPRNPERYCGTLPIRLGESIENDADRGDIWG